MANKSLREETYQNIMIVLACTGAGAAVEATQAGLLLGSLAVAGRYLLPAYAKQAPQRKYKPRTAANEYAVYHKGTKKFTRRLSDYFKPRIIDTPSINRPLVMNELKYYSTDMKHAPVVLTESMVRSVFRCVQRCPNPDRNLSRNWAIKEQRVRVHIYEAWMRYLVKTQRTTDVQLIAQTRNKWYTLHEDVHTAFSLMKYVALLEQPPAGREAPRLIKRRTIV